MTKNGWFMSAAAAVGDLSSPFYDEERQRDVWNEASAVGFQLFLLLSLLAATGMLWIGGPPAVPYALTLLGVVGVASFVTLIYAQRLGVDAQAPERLNRARMFPFLLLIVLLIIGFVRAVPDGGGFAAGLAEGAAVGVGIGLVCLGVGWWWRNRSRGGSAR